MGGGGISGLTHFGSQALVSIFVDCVSRRDVGAGVAKGCFAEHPRVEGPHAQGYFGFPLGGAWLGH